MILTIDLERLNQLVDALGGGLFVVSVWYILPRIRSLINKWK